MGVYGAFIRVFGAFLFARLGVSVWHNHENIFGSLCRLNMAAACGTGTQECSVMCDGTHDHSFSVYYLQTLSVLFEPEAAICHLASKSMVSSAQSIPAGSC